MKDMKKNRPIYRFRNQNRKGYRVFVHPNPYEADGDCDPPDKKRPIIRIRQSLFRPERSRRQLAIILEELLHAHDFTLTEKCVRKYAANTTKLLYKLGWRRIKRK